MIITLNEKGFEIDRKDVLFNLKQIERAWKSLGEKGGYLRDWKGKDDVVEMVALGEISIVNKEGRYGGTWGCKEAVIEYASYCSPTFRRAVRKSFIALSEGRLQDAVGIVETTMVSQELLDNALMVEDMLKVAIVNWKDDKGRSIKSKNICIRKHVLSKTLTGNSNIKELREMFDAKNFVKSLYSANSSVGLTAFIETSNIVMSMMSVGLGYYEIRDSINKMSEMWNEEK